MSNPSAPATHGSFTIERQFQATAERVFAAFSTVEARRRWFVGPPGWVEKERTLDFQIDGIETTIGVFPDGKETNFRARFEDIVPNRRIVFSYRMHIGDWPISISLNTVEFTPQSGGTKMTFTEHATFINGFDDPNAEGRKAGSIGLIERLAASLADVTKESQ